mmetsp:Transcript_41615/g.84072  ORF Transcript_41615/g.84072 Transcript_41615/m.84072 type:complete len:348 (+) Transcript_41615:50-1093(+)
MRCSTLIRNQPTLVILLLLVSVVPTQSLATSVFDGTFSSQACKQLNTACKSLGETSVRHRLMDRRTIDPSSHSISGVGTVEHGLDSVLKQLNDPAPFVEWWWRDEWRHLDMHRDVDEVLARDYPEAGLQCPHHGHVLYLQIGEEAVGPTVLWETRDDENNNPTSLDVSRMVVVPPQNGRLLRFPGSMLHSVPRPNLSYLDVEHGGTGGVIHTRRQRQPGDEESTLRRRSVILFNTWLSPPTGFGLSSSFPLPYNSEALTHGIGCEERVLCRDKSLWDAALVQEQGHNDHGDERGQPELARVKVGLLGGRERRGTLERHFVGWASSGAGAAAALGSSRNVTSLLITQL